MINDRDQYEFNFSYWIARLLSEGYELEEDVATAIGAAGQLTLTTDSDANVTLAVAAGGPMAREFLTRGEQLDAQALNPMTLDPAIWPNATTAFYREPRQRLQDAASYRLLKPSPPDWVSFPLVSLSRVSAEQAPSMFLVGVDQRPLSDVLLAGLRSALSGGAFRRDGDGQSQLEPKVAAALGEINTFATEIMSLMLPGSPAVAVDLRDPDSLFARGPLLLEAVRAGDGQRLKVEELSEAERYWYSVGVQMAIARYDANGEAGLIVLDEPDRGLHPQARRHLGGALRELARATGFNVIVSTHGPELVAQSTRNLWHVVRGGDGHSDLNHLAPPLLQNLSAFERLGLLPADVLQFMRVLVIVEGQHDKAVIGELLRDELALAAAHIVVLRGTDHLSSILDCQLLMQFTDSRVCVVLDNTRGRIVEAWENARKALQRGAYRDAERIVKKAVPTAGASDEEQKLCTFLLEGIRQDAIGRVEVFGLTAPDVIWYLPVRRFHPTAASWEDAVALAQKAGEKSVKRWLGRNGAPVTEETCRDAARAVGKLPEDMQRLGKELVRGGSR